LKDWAVGVEVLTLSHQEEVQNKTKADLTRDMTGDERMNTIESAKDGDLLAMTMSLQDSGPTYIHVRQSKVRQ
jgi:hypothetical protein